MNINEVKFDCRYFKGTIPCQPNKDHNVDCSNCNFYSKIGKRILIIKLGALGDVIRTTPLAVRYKNMYPDCHISWLTLSPDVLPKDAIDSIYAWDTTSVFVLQNKTFDIAINLDKEEEACILLSKVNALEKYGFLWENDHIAPATPAAEHKMLTGFFDHISYKNTKHYLEEIFEICHLDFRDEPYLINYDKKLASQWKSKLQELAGQKIIVALNTGCGTRWLTRLWPEEKWIELINLLKNDNYFPIILGGQQEDEKNKFLADQTHAYYPGTFPLKEFFALTDACDIIVTQVSMMMHVAVALKKKIVLMNNIFNKHEFYLYNKGVIVEPETGCDCFYGNSCKRERACMHDLKANTVFNEIKKLS